MTRHTFIQGVKKCIDRRMNRLRRNKRNFDSNSNSDCASECIEGNAKSDNDDRSKENGGGEGDGRSGDKEAENRDSAVKHSKEEEEEVDEDEDEKEEDKINRILQSSIFRSQMLRYTKPILDTHYLINTVGGENMIRYE